MARQCRRRTTEGLRTALQRQAHSRAINRWRRQVKLALAGRLHLGRKIFNSPVVKIAVPVIQPNLKALVRQCLLKNDVRRPVPIDIQHRDCQRGFVRFEWEVGIPAPGEMKLNGPKRSLRAQPADIDQHSCIRLVIAIEIGSRQCPTEGCPNIAGRPKSGRPERTREPVLRPEGRCQDQCREDYFESKGCRLHSLAIKYKFCLTASQQPYRCNARHRSRRQSEK